MALIDEPVVLGTEEQLIATVQITCERDQMRHVMQPGLNELIGEVDRQGIEITGPWFTHHFRIEPGIFDFEICVPVAAPVKAAGRVSPSEWPAMRIARTVYNGPYSGLGQAWGEFDAWAESNGHERAQDLWEVYLGDQKTQLNRPLR